MLHVKQAKSLTLTSWPGPFGCVDASDANSCPADMGGYRIGCTAPPAQEFECGCDNEILITNDCRLVHNQVRNLSTLFLMVF